MRFTQLYSTEQKIKNETYGKYGYSLRKSLIIDTATDLATENLPSKTIAAGLSFFSQRLLLLSTFQQFTYYAVGQWLGPIGYQLS